MSIEHTLGGNLARQKKHMRGVLAVFRDDIERLTPDLYGDVRSQAMDRVVLAVFRIIQEFTNSTVSLRVARMSHRHSAGRLCDQGPYRRGRDH
jgi:hypothetical protein